MSSIGRLVFLDPGARDVKPMPVGGAAGVRALGASWAWALEVQGSRVTPRLGGRGRGEASLGSELGPVDHAGGSSWPEVGRGGRAGPWAPGPKCSFFAVGAVE